MSFAAPGYAALAGLAALIVIQYFLKLRRPAWTMPSTFLWQRTLADTRANAPWQRLHPDPLLLLQLLALAALVLALMRPFVLRPGTVGEDVVAVLDASMATQATDDTQGVPGTRFAAEVAALRGLIASLPPEHSMSIVRMDARPRVLIARTADHGALSGALDGQAPGFARPDVRAALALAYGLAGGQGGDSGRVEVFRAATTAPPEPAGGIALTDRPFGNARSANLAITAFAAAKGAAGTVSAIIRVANTGDRSLDSDIEIRADGKLVDVPSVSVPAGQQVAVESGTLPGSSHVLEATLTLSDTLQADNTAWTVLNATSGSRVLLVSAANIFLRYALATSPGVTLREVTPAGYVPQFALGQDLVIFDGWLPATLPATNLLLVHPPARRLGLVGAAKARSVGTPRTDDDPAALLRYMTVGAIHIAASAQLQAVAWARVALRDPGGPLILESTSGPPGGAARKVVVIGFDLNASDLVLSLDFPVFVSNLLAWLAPGLSLDATTYQAGSIVHIGVGAGATSIAVRGPDGSTRVLSPGQSFGTASSVPFADTGQPGIYALTETGSGPPLHAQFAVSAAAPGAIDAAAVPGARAGSRRPAPAGRVPFDLTGALVAVVLAVLVGEWYLAMRRR